jgi:endoglycosylceramidase
MIGRASTVMCLMLLAAQPARGGVLRTDGSFFRDDHGRVVLLRGVDVAGNSKVPPFEPISDGAQLDPLPRDGLDAVRLLFTWEAYEPQPGVYDDNYLAWYTRTVEAAGARGLWVIVDFHQDAFSRFALAGCGEGFPSWALPSSVPPATPDNGAACADWGKRQLGDPQLGAAWDAFYADTSGVRTRYLMMVARVAAALASEPSLVGYDLLNEPAGDEVTQIGPLYEDAARAIRAVDATAILFVSPAGITSAGNATRLSRPTFGNFAYAPHFYDPGIFLYHGWGGSDENGPFAEMTGTASAWGVPLFVGEYGAPPSTDLVDPYLGTLHQQLDRALASGAQWVYTPGWTATAKDGWNTEDFSIVDDTGALRANFRLRPTLQYVAGTPTAFTVSDETVARKNALQLTWQHDPAAGETVLFAPLVYFGGATSLAADGDLRCKSAGDFVHCTAPSAGVKRLRVSAPSPRCGLTGAETLLLVALWRRLRRRR